MHARQFVSFFELKNYYSFNIRNIYFCIAAPNILNLNGKKRFAYKCLIITSAKCVTCVLHEQLNALQK